MLHPTNHKSIPQRLLRTRRRRRGCYDLCPEIAPSASQPALGHMAIATVMQLPPYLLSLSKFFSVSPQPTHRDTHQTQTAKDALQLHFLPGRVRHPAPCCQCRGDFARDAARRSREMHTQLAGPDCSRDGAGCRSLHGAMVSGKRQDTLSCVGKGDMMEFKAVKHLFSPSARIPSPPSSFFSIVLVVRQLPRQIHIRAGRRLCHGRLWPPRQRHRCVSPQRPKFPAAQRHHDHHQRASHRKQRL